jgi:hypothetical protein
MTLMLFLAPVVSVAAPDDVAAIAEPNPANVQQFNNFEQAFNNIEGNVFQQHGTAKQARTSIETRLKLQIDELHRICELNDAQRQKLKLAGSNDVRRFFDEFEALKKKYKGGKKDQEAWNNFWQDIQPLQAKMTTGLFGAESFFAKSVRLVLNADQVAKYDEVTSERRQFHYRASIETVLDTVENTVPLRDDQHDAIVKLLIEETKPPISFGQYDHQAVMCNLSRVPEAKLKPVLDARQWKLMQAQIDQNRGMEQWLRQQGVLPKEEPEVKKLKARVRRQVKQSDATTAGADAAHPENKKQE